LYLLFNWTIIFFCFFLIFAKISRFFPRLLHPCLTLEVCIGVRTHINSARVISWSKSIIKYIYSICLVHINNQWPLWSYGSWIYNYLCNQCLSPPTLRVRISLIVRCTQYIATLCDKACQWLVCNLIFKNTFVFQLYCGSHFLLVEETGVPEKTTACRKSLTSFIT
jgi:hypothetical protein